MNISSILGILSALTVFVLALASSTNNSAIFLNTHAILIVIGGTAAASMICYPLPTLFSLVKVIGQKILGRYSQAHEKVIMEIVDLSKGYRTDNNYLASKVGSISTPFLKEAIELMLQGGMTPAALDDILEKRALTHSKRYEKEAKIFMTMGKFPPAFGLMGTTLGMIGLMQNLGTADSFKLLGPSMAIGLVATLYGIAITNFVLVPMGENLSKLNEQDEILREMVRDGIKLLRVKEHPLVVEENLKSYLLPGERSKLKKLA